MKLSELIEQLNALKDKHGDVEAVIHNPELAEYNTVIRLHPVYPASQSKFDHHFLEDQTKPAWCVCISSSYF